jgi:hypothetical protein
VLGDPLELSGRQAAEVLDDVARLRRRTRRSLGMPWFPLLCFGALTILSAPLVAAAGTAALLPLWIIAGGAGMLLTGRHYRRRARRHGVTGGGRRIWLVAAAMFAGCLAAGVAGGALGGEAAGLLGPIVLVFAGYLILGWLQRSFAPPLAVAPVAALAAALAAASVPAWIVELTFGAGLMAAGAGLRAAGRRP